MSRLKRWKPAVRGEQEIHMVFTVSYYAIGNCYHLPAALSGPPEDCYPAESDAEISHMRVTITNDEGEKVPEDSDLGQIIMGMLDYRLVEQQMLETEGD